MKILVVSDSHGATASLCEVLKRKRGCIDAVFHLGDGCDDILYAPEYTGNIPVYSIKGNCDVYPVVSTFPRVITEIGGKRIFACHGHAYSVKDGIGTLYYAAAENGADIALYGHTHFQDRDIKDGMVLLNPGSVRDGHYAVVEISGDEIKTELY